MTAASAEEYVTVLGSLLTQWISLGSLLGSARLCSLLIESSELYARHRSMRAQILNTTRLIECVHNLTTNATFGLNEGSLVVAYTPIGNETANMLGGLVDCLREVDVRGPIEVRDPLMQWNPEYHSSVEDFEPITSSRTHTIIQSLIRPRDWSQYWDYSEAGISQAVSISHAPSNSQMLNVVLDSLRYLIGSSYLKHMPLLPPLG